MIPWTDWQFWTVTGLALAGALFVAWPFLPRRKKADASCGRCASGNAARTTRTPLTIRGK